MITSYKQITGRYLKSNKKRTILTIIGIVLSVALISSIGLFVKGLQSAQLEQTKNDYGSFHLMFKNTDEELFSKVINNPKVSKYGYYKLVKDIKVNDRLTANEITATDDALELTPYKIKEGNMPVKDNEIALEQWSLKYFSETTKVGDKININNKEFILTGILENSIKSQLDNKPILLTKDNNISKKGSVLLVEIGSKTNIRKGLDELEKLTTKENYVENTPVLMIEGAGGQDSGSKGLFATLSVIIGIVVVSTIAVIYNSFQISVVERIKEFGLLRAVGTTPRQVRNIVFREATMLAIIGVPLGLLCGCIAMAVIKWVFNIIGGDSVMPLKLVIDPFVIGLSTVVGIISIYLSALIPAVFAGRISPLEAISSRTSITKGKIKRSNNRIIKMLFGFEGAMAAKNIKRNRKRYRITVFSVLISVVLFVSFKSLVDMLINVTNSPNESRDIHFTVYSQGDDAKKNSLDFDELAKSIKNSNLVDKVYKSYSTYSFETAINNDKKVKEVENINGVYNSASVHGTEKTILEATIAVYDDDSFGTAKKYLDSGSIDSDKLNKENGVVLINRNAIDNLKTKKKYEGPIANLKVGDEIELQLQDSDKPVEFGKGQVKKVKVLAILNNEPFDYYGSQTGLKLITTKEVAKALTGSDITINSLNIALKDVKDENAELTDLQAKTKINNNLNVINNIDQNRRDKSTMLMLQILVYGFIIVVSLISSVNIVNTLTTNIILRKREFATLKSIGLTQRALRKMIILEGLLYAFWGTLYGAVIGSGLSYLMFKGLGGVREFPWSIPWEAIVIAGIGAVVIGYLSVLSPLARIKKDNLIEVIREE
ncbi:ABC transporter permease [Clostridium sp. 'White wine YQ']|uniref:ABC transporter permease n=1 Tax=Clostridium sp. 'White wine YQ' TaxID=3027474 RepID=UPI0023660D65|nr:FtsX-like permease family protein [Clostridium sp. 'White wine YQ']MDD7794828.1 FtsX-like permease family protein [Clostridium sp. 'White wine YQ']